MPPQPTIAAVIPARFGSMRLPGKALADLGGEPLVVRTWRRVCEALPQVIVATDDVRIAEAITSRGGVAVLTGEHDNGTSRVAAVAPDVEVVVNVQGDEPFVDPAHILAVAHGLRDGDAVSTAAAPLLGDPADSARVKVVTDGEGRALYFSRAPIPSGGPFRLHVGLYAFRRATLGALVSLPPSPLERSERLEQLRWLEAGHRIRVVPVDSAEGGIDTPADLQRARLRLSEISP